MVEQKETATPEQDRLRQRQADEGFRVMGVFPGTGNPTPEQVAAEINSSLDRLAAGDFEEVGDDELD